MIHSKIHAPKSVHRVAAYEASNGKNFVEWCSHFVGVLERGEFCKDVSLLLQLCVALSSEWFSFDELFYVGLMVNKHKQRPWLTYFSLRQLVRSRPAYRCRNIKSWSPNCQHSSWKSHRRGFYTYFLYTPYISQ